jgi:AcrR family transcriptional regulator
MCRCGPQPGQQAGAAVVIPEVRGVRLTRATGSAEHHNGDKDPGSPRDQSGAQQRSRSHDTSVGSPRTLIDRSVEADGTGTRSASTLPPVGAETRDQLIEAAIAVIETDGEQAIKVRDIATRAGVTEPSLYHFFGDRNGLIEEAQAVRFGRDQMDVLAGFADAILACQSRQDFVELVRTAFTNALQPTRSPQRFTRINVLGSIQGRPNLQRKLADHQQETNKVVGDALRVAQKLGFIRPDLDCYTLAVWTVGLATGRVLIEIDPELVDGDEWNRLAVEALLAATGNPPDNLSDWHTDT